MNWFQCHFRADLAPEQQHELLSSVNWNLLIHPESIANQVWQDSCFRKKPHWVTKQSPTAEQCGILQRFSNYSIETQDTTYNREQRPLNSWQWFYCRMFCPLWELSSCTISWLVMYIRLYQRSCTFLLLELGLWSAPVWAALFHGEDCRAISSGPSWIGN